MALGKPAWQEARQTLTRLLSKDEGRLRDDAALRQAAIIPRVITSHCSTGLQHVCCSITHALSQQMQASALCGGK